MPKTHTRKGRFEASQLLGFAWGTGAFPCAFYLNKINIYTHIYPCTVETEYIHMYLCVYMTYHLSLAASQNQVPHKNFPKLHVYISPTPNPGCCYRLRGQSFGLGQLGSVLMTPINHMTPISHVITGVIPMINLHTNSP